MKRAEVVGNNSIGNDRDHERVKGRSEDGVLFARVADANDVVDVAEGELEQLVGQDTGSVCEAKETVVGEDGAQAHGAGVENGLVAQTAETGMAVDNVDALADDYVAEDGEEGEDGGEGRLAVHDKEGHVVDLEPIGQVAHSAAAVVLMRDDDDLVPAVNELLRQLVDVTLDAARLREEEVADHGNVVRHGAAWCADAAETLPACCATRSVSSTRESLSSWVLRERC